MDDLSNTTATLTTTTSDPPAIKPDPAPAPTITLSRHELRRLVQRELVRHVHWQRRRGLLRYGGVLPNLERIRVRWETMKSWRQDDGYTPVIMDSSIPEPKKRVALIPIDNALPPPIIDARQSWIARMVKR